MHQNNRKPSWTQPVKDIPELSSSSHLGESWLTWSVFYSQTHWLCCQSWPGDRWEMRVKGTHGLLQESASLVQWYKLSATWKLCHCAWEWCSRIHQCNDITYGFHEKEHHNARDTSSIFPFVQEFIPQPSGKMGTLLSWMQCTCQMLDPLPLLCNPRLQNQVFLFLMSCFIWSEGGI